MQGGNEVWFFIADAIFARKFRILDSKNVTNFRPSHKYGTAWSLIPKTTTADPDPMVRDPWSQGCDPRSHPSDPWSHPFDPWSYIPRYDPDSWLIVLIWLFRVFELGHISTLPVFKSVKSISTGLYPLKFR